jgi:hypothetical protein
MIENETNDILEVGDVAEGYQEPQNEPIGEQIEETPQEAKEEVKEEAKEPEKRKLTAEERQKQIAHQTKLKWEAQRALEAKQAEIDAKIAKLEELEKKHNVNEDLPPDPSKYSEGMEQQYVNDLADFKANKKIKEERVRQEREREESEQRSYTENIKKQYEKQYQAKVAKDPSFAERELNVARYLDLTKRPDLVTLIMDDDDRADIIDYLGGNLEELENLATLSPVRASKEFGKITARMTLPKSQAVSKANAPMNPVKQTGANAVKDISEINDFAEYSKKMNAYIYGR